MASLSAEGLPAAIERQAAAGVAEADSVVLVVDGQSGLHPSDEEVLSWLRQRHPGKPVVLAVNKCESITRGATQVRCAAAGAELRARVVDRPWGVAARKLR